MSAAADRNLLFGILALQMDFISREALIQAMHDWVLDKQKQLGQLLLDQGTIQADEHALLNALVAKHLERHGNDAEKSLAVLSSLNSARQELQSIVDPDLQATLAAVSSVQDDPDSTTAYRPADTALRYRILRPH